MKKVCSLLAVAVLLMGGSASSFAGTPYASGNIGVTWLSDSQATLGDYSERDEYQLEVDFDSGIALTGALGYDFGSTRLEAELGYQSNDAAEIRWYEDGFDDSYDAYELSGDVSLTTLMLNGYYDIKPSDASDLEIFLTAGIGAAFYTLDFGEVDDDEYRGTYHGSTLAYQIGAGLAYAVSSELTVEARYRYFSTAEFSTDDDFDTFDDGYNLDLSSNAMLIGLRYNL
ncbi:porin family protein [Prosthecochloris sp. ZM]|uniref:Surface antigen msp4 family protein n=1 Tax=Prosthecochloris aestuarii (strain DSM 271 / SK 413) TaxID=290512 RepID=B4S4P8_PROA2|nr:MULTISPECIES: acyloxyacyl hydrolase [Prosthecochloris]ACF46944.1 surface antigen msp4 family protein [Prosthecochloris aestuarii DSM 271]RDD29526.1 porin family protein [Prosthecochloris sp. ZM]